MKYSDVSGVHTAIIIRTITLKTRQVLGQFRKQTQSLYRLFRFRVVRRKGQFRRIYIVNVFQILFSVHLWTYDLLVVGFLLSLKIICKPVSYSARLRSVQFSLFFRIATFLDFSHVKF